MPSKNPRINVVLDDTLYRDIQFLAETDGVSLSAKVKDLIKEALEVQEDLYLAGLAAEREKNWDESNARSHDEIWS